MKNDIHPTQVATLRSCALGMGQHLIKVKRAPFELANTRYIKPRGIL